MWIRLLVAVAFCGLGLSGLKYAYLSLKTQSAVDSQKKLLAKFQFDEALRRLDAASKLGLQSAELWETRGTLLYQMGSFRLQPELIEEATQSFQKAVRLEPLNERRWREYARHQLATKDYKGGLVSLNRAFARDPYNASLHFLKGFALQNLGRQTEARKAYETSYLIRPNSDAAIALKAMGFPVPKM